MWKTVLESPVGELHVLAVEAGLRALVWSEEELQRLAHSESPVERPTHPLFKRLKKQLAGYFAGKLRSFDVPLDPLGTEFQLAAWKALREIPFGTTRTYAEQAVVIGRPKAVRAVGAANGRNPLSIVVPCHRVIGSNGKLTGFAGGIDAKRFLLELEARVATRAG